MTIHHIALRTHALDALVAFYREILGLPERARNTGADGQRRSVWLELSPGVLMLERADATEPTPNAGSLDLLALRAVPADLSHWRARLAAAGIPVESSTEHTLYFRDPDGRRVGLSTHPLA